MRISDALKWFNRHGATSVSFIVLFGACAWFDFIARIRMDLANRQFVIMDNRTLRELRVIDLVREHHWLAITYFAVFFIGLLWLEFRAAPRWAVWIIFILFALPALFYAQACMHISNKFILWSTMGR
jgi:hypothetical protein